MSRKRTVNQGCMSLSTYYLEYGRHVGQLRRRRRRRRRRAYAPTSNTASHGNHEKINSWVSFSFPYEYGAPLLVIYMALESKKYTAHDLFPWKRSVWRERSSQHARIYIKVTLPYNKFKYSWL